MQNVHNIGAERRIGRQGIYRRLMNGVTHVTGKKIIAASGMAVMLLLIISLPTYAMTTFTEMSGPAGVAQLSPTWGLTWVDVNSDGLEDLYIGNHHYFDHKAGILIPPALYINNGNLTFSDSADIFGIIPQGDFHGANWGDFNNDGYPDLFQTQGSGRQNPIGAADRLYKNSAEGILTEMGAAAGVDMPFARGRSGFWMDYNTDGLLDLFICNDRSLDYPTVLMKNNGDGTFSATGPGLTGPIIGTAVDYNNDLLVDFFLVSRERLWLYRNNGNGTFTDVSLSTGLARIKYVQGFAWGDFNNDGDMDLYLARGMMGDTLQWGSSGINFTSIVSAGTEVDMNFSSSGTHATFDIYDFLVNVDRSKFYIGAQGIHPASFPFTLSVDDPLVQGKPVFSTVDNFSYYVWVNAGKWFISTITDPSAVPVNFFNGTITSDGSISGLVTAGLQIYTGPFPNMLLENTGNGGFVNVAPQAGVADSSQSTTARWADVDNDGYLDLYVVNVGDVANKPNKLFMNNGDNTFTEVARASGVEGNVAGRGESVAVADFDNDGFLDLAVSNGFGPAPFDHGPLLLYHNNGNATNHWLKVKLVGKVSNRDGVGTYVRADVGQASYTRQQNNGVSRFSQDSTVLHFGLGTSPTVDALTVLWPSGVSQTMHNISADQELVVVEPNIKVEVFPENVLYLPGQTLRYLLVLTNKTNVDIDFSFWTNITTPVGGTYPVTGELISPQQVQLAPFGTLSKTIRHDLPLGAGAGDYVYHTFVGPYPSSWSKTDFPFTVTTTLP